jgi:NAD(P)-dependent dehydrogenase (short-subunit alcohol dehydrogenase family)
MPGTLIIGAGPGIGLSVARRFAREAMPIAVIGRSASTVDAATEALAADGVAPLGLTADSTDEVALRAALDKVVERHGVPDVYRGAHQTVAVA